MAALWRNTVPLYGCPFSHTPPAQFAPHSESFGIAALVGHEFVIAQLADLPPIPAHRTPIRRAITGSVPAVQRCVVLPTLSTLPDALRCCCCCTLTRLTLVGVMPSPPRPPVSGVQSPRTLTGQEDGERPLLDEDWKDMMMVDYGTGTVSSIPPTSIAGDTLPAEAGRSLPIFKHWSSVEDR